MSKQDNPNIIQLTPSTLIDPEVSPDEWVNRFARLYNIQYNYKTNSVSQDGEPIEVGLFISQMRLACHKLGMNEIKKLLTDAFVVWRKEQARQYLKSLRNELKFKANEADLVGDWVEAVSGKRDELDVAVMRHWCWQVKRKLFGLQVDFHIMTVLVGKSGGGKSVAVQKLIEPLSEVTTFRDMKIFTDPFAKRAFNRSYIMHFDELARSQDADVNALKDVITASTTDWRGIGSETIHSAAQNCTFIGCSNLPLRERIKDPTSGRRFWQLDCAERLNWERVNSVDYFSLWRSVDENGPCPILPHLDAIRVVQEREIQHQDLIEHWLSTSCEPCPFDQTSPNTDALYSSFSDWCRNQTIYDHDGLQSFARGLQLRIHQLKWDASSKRSNRGTIWSLRLKVEQHESQNKILGLTADQSLAVSSDDTETTKAQKEEEENVTNED